MKKAVLAVVTAAAVISAALVPSSPAGGGRDGRAVESDSVRVCVGLVRGQQLPWQTTASVTALAVAGDTVFAGGLFTRIRPPGKPVGEGDAARKYVAAFNRTTGAPTRFAPNVNDPIWSIATSPDGKWVVIGGDFTAVNGQPRQHVALFSVATGNLVAGSC